MARRRLATRPPPRGRLLLRLAFAALLGVLAWHLWSGPYGPSASGHRTLKPSSRAARLSGDHMAATASIGELGAAAQASKEGLGAAAAKATEGPVETETAEPAGAAKPAADSTPKYRGSAAKTARLCSEECGAPYSRNGVCDDGRPTLAGSRAGPPAAAGDGAPSAGDRQPVRCDLGTDCADCGAFEAPAGEASGWRPIAEIRRRGFDVFTRRSLAPWPFWMAYTDPSHDVDVSAAVDLHGVVEQGISRVWHKILEHGCPPPAAGGPPGLVVDVGGNFGWYTLLAAAAGCRVVVWEPVSYFAAFLKYGLLRNGLTQRVQLREAIVSDVPGTLELVVPQRGIWGTAGIGGANIDHAIDNKGELDRVAKRTERVDAAVGPGDGGVLLLKVDVEGYEPGVLRSAKKLLLDGKVENIVLEYSPGVAERAGNFSWFEEFPRMLLGLLKAGFEIVHLVNTEGAKNDWEAPLPHFERVTAEVLTHDMDDAQRLQDHTLGCLPPEAAAVPGMSLCGTIPEGIDPHSFRSTFGHNTNVWAYRHADGQRRPWETPSQRTSTLFQPNHTSFFSPHGHGAARRLCKDLSPAAQLAHRCRCTNATVCGEAQAMIERLDAEGKLALQPVKRRWQDGELGIERWR